MSDKNKISKRSFLKLMFSAFAFLSLGGFSFLIPKKDVKKTSQPSSGYGKGGYGA